MYNVNTLQFPSSFFTQHGNSITFCSKTYQIREAFLSKRVCNYEALKVLTRDETNHVINALRIPVLGLVFLVPWVRIRVVKYHFHPKMNKVMPQVMRNRDLKKHSEICTTQKLKPRIILLYCKELKNVTYISVHSVVSKTNLVYKRRLHSLHKRLPFFQFSR